MKTSHSSPNSLQANASDEPHCPAPVSVASLLDAGLRVLVRLRHGGVRLVRAGGRDALVLVVDVRRAYRARAPGAGRGTAASGATACRPRAPPRGSRSRARARPPAGSAPSGRSARGRGGPAGCFVPGCSGGSGAPGRSGSRLTQCVGIRSSVRRNFVGASLTVLMRQTYRRQTAARERPRGRDSSAHHARIRRDRRAAVLGPADHAELDALARHVVALSGKASAARSDGSPVRAHRDGARVAAGGRTWWGNCAWDGLGIVVALGLRGDGEEQGVTLRVRRRRASRATRSSMSPCPPRTGGTTSASPERRCGSSGRRRRFDAWCWGPAGASAVASCRPARHCPPVSPCAGMAGASRPAGGRATRDASQALLGEAGLTGLFGLCDQSHARLLAR